MPLGQYDGSPVTLIIFPPLHRYATPFRHYWTEQSIQDVVIYLFLPSSSQAFLSRLYSCCRLILFECLFVTVPPSLTTTPTDQTVIEGTTATLHCTATGNPTPKITWTKDGITVGSGDMLSFEANRNRSGTYWCSADNGLNPSVNESAYLDVQCKYGNWNYLIIRGVGYSLIQAM